MYNPPEASSVQTRCLFSQSVNSSYTFNFIFLPSVSCNVRRLSFCSRSPLSPFSPSLSFFEKRKEKAAKRRRPSRPPHFQLNVAVVGPRRSLPSFCFSFCELIQWLEQQGGNRTQTMSSVVPGGRGLPYGPLLPPHSLLLENNKPLPAPPPPEQRRNAVTVIAI